MSETFEDSWKETMFVDEAAVFSEIAGSEPPGDAADFFAHLVKTWGDATAGALELGCGNGRMGKAIAPLVPFYLGTDLSHPLIGEAFAARADNQVFLQGDFRKLVADHSLIGVANVFRCYTSLGYFPEAEEIALLKGLRRQVRKGFVLVDTFNGNWFRLNGGFERTRALPKTGVTFLERYTHVGEGPERVEALWRYTRDEGEVRDIPFTLECYDSERVESIAHASGWSVAAAFFDYRTDARYGEETGVRERIIAVLA